MELHLIEVLLCRPGNLKHTSKVVLIVATSFLLLSAILVFDRPSFRPTLFSFSSNSPSLSANTINSTSMGPVTECDIAKGEWVRDPEAPYYTNTTCWTIQEHQNCIKYGRPDLDFLKWRWKPDACELPRFDPARFLELVTGKSLAFVGDSLARNQMQSLMCLLSKVEYPKDVSNASNEDFKRMFYTNHNFTISIFWSPFLVKSQEAADGLWNLYLDEADESWASKIQPFDYIIISGGNWFTRPSMFYEQGHLVGCHYCQLPNVTDLTLRYSNRVAFRTALRAVGKLSDGLTILRTLSPSHFENGEWNMGGNCVRTKPFRSSEMRMEGLDLEMYDAQVVELREVERERGSRFRLLDVSGAMVLRADGHPSRYGHRAEENVTLYNDCVHWCLPAGSC